MIHWLIAATALAACVAMRGAVQSDPVLHVLVQIPLLGLVGWCVAKAMGERAFAPVSVLLVVITMALFWMLPRSVDAALADWQMELFKFVSVPLFIGAGLAVCWAALHPVLRGFVKAQSISMLGILGFLYTHAPVRICNAYLVNDQERLGVGFLLVAGGLAVLWTVPLMFGPAWAQSFFPFTSNKRDADDLSRYRSQIL